MGTVYGVPSVRQRASVFRLRSDLPRGNPRCQSVEAMLGLLRRRADAPIGDCRNSGPVWSLVDPGREGGPLSVRRRIYGDCPVCAAVELYAASATSETEAAAVALYLLMGYDVLVRGTPESPSSVIGYQAPIPT